MMPFKVKPVSDELEDYPNLMDDLTGRVIFSFNEVYEDELTFYCGPETKEGYLLDWTDCGMYAQLETLFKSVGFDVEVGAAENYHVLRLTEGEDGDKMWRKLRNYLIMAGAVEMK